MAAESTYDVAASGGNREDLADIIGFLKPMDTELYNRLGKVPAYGTKHEWLLDEFQAAAQNAKTEGGDFSADTINQPTRGNNYTQINKKQVNVSGTQEAVNKAGRTSDYDYHVAKKTQEMMRDIEYTLMKGTSASGDGSAARSAQGIESWISTNLNSSAASRSLTLALVNTVLKSVYDAGGVPDVTYLPSALAASFATLTSGSGDYRRVAPDAKQLVDVVTTYVSPFDNSIEVRTHRYMTATTIVFLDTAYWKVAQLRAPFHEQLAKAGDSVRGQVISELTLESRQQKSSGILQNVT